MVRFCVLCCVVPCFGVLCFLCYVLSYCDVWRLVLLYGVVLCCVVFSCVVLCCVLFCFTVLCCAVLCCVVM